MHLILNIVITAIISLSMNAGIVSTVSVTPEEAVDDFFVTMTSGDEDMMDAYMDNSYVNFMNNVQGDEKTVDGIREALFRNFSYSIVDIATKEDCAVAKVEIKSNDFSDVMKGYDRDSYKYVMDNLYTEDIADKDKLDEKCLAIYVDQLDEAADKEPSVTRTIFVPMVDNGYYGWNILLSDELMKDITGGLKIPGVK